MAIDSTVICNYRRAALRFGAADLRRFRGSVYAVVGLG
jgi:hypothetical protein